MKQMNALGFVLSILVILVGSSAAQANSLPVGTGGVSCMLFGFAALAGLRYRLYKRRRRDGKGSWPSRRVSPGWRSQ
jgi:hypothetical protein